MYAPAAGGRCRGVQSLYMSRWKARCLSALLVFLWCCRTVEPPRQAEPAARGFPAAEAIAVNPQGSPMVAPASPGGGIARLLPGSGSLVLAETAGRPAGLAFDASGDLYVTDRQLGAVFRVNPWGQILVMAENLGSPEGIAAGADGNFYVTDPGRSRVYRLKPGGETAVWCADPDGARGIAVSAASGHVYISDRQRRIWRLTPDGRGRTLWASLADEGEPAGMALDEKGNLYVARDGGGKVSVLDPEGRLIETYRLPGPRVTGVAFGGFDSDVLFVVEAQAGAIYKLRVPHRAQRWPWEPDEPLRILEPADGAILNRHDGEKTAAGLRITVKGVCRAGTPVTVNGAPAAVRDGRFEALVVLRERENRIVAEAPGGLRDAVTAVWDRDSFRRYRFSTDDNIWFLRDIARHADRYRSIFDNPYLAFWRQMHRKYGVRVHHNIYYETAGFNLSQMPDKFRSEWQRNASWMRLSFHARANDPARPYLHAAPEKIREDYRLVKREIERFAGKELLSPVTTIHWAATTAGAARALREEGVRVLPGVGRFREDMPYGGYYLSIPQVRHVLGRDYWKDTRQDIIFIRHDIVINNVPLDQIAPYLEKVAADPHESEVMELIIHEQYFYADYRAYEPDYRQRCERAIEWVTRRGYRPVFFEEGFLGTGAEGARERKRGK